MPEADTPRYWLPVEHNMLRRNEQNNYHADKKVYMVSLHVEGMAQLLGSIERNTDAETKSPQEGEARQRTDAPATITCRLTPLGEAMRQAWLTLPLRFPNISIRDRADEYVIMPEHFHGILYVTGYLKEHLSDVVRLFKARVAMTYRRLLLAGTTVSVGTATDWLTAYRAQSPAIQEATRRWVAEQEALLRAATRRSTQSAPPPFRLSASGSHSKVGFLFGIGYNDSILLDERNLEGHRLYILNNPKSRWQRTHNRRMLTTNCAPISTALTLKALEGYLRRECPTRDVTEEKLAPIRQHLQYAATRRSTQPEPTASPAPQPARASAPQPARAFAPQPSSMIICHSYGDRSLLERRLLPVVCHRKDAALFSLQKARCLKEAEDGAVMVSAGISPKEREIMQTIRDAGYPIVYIKDNGFPDLYHPSQEYIDLCDASRVLLLTPWHYHYRPKDDTIRVAYCKTMNCIAQAICRKKDDWWTAPSLP